MLVSDCAVYSIFNFLIDANYYLSSQGYGKEYEEMQAQIESIHKEVDTFLADVKKKYDPKSKLDSKSGSKDWFIVIPRTVTDLPEEFVRQPRKLKEFFKYKHSLLTTSLEKVKVLEDKMGDIQRNIFRTILGRFSEFDQYWKRVVQCLAKLDCILSLHSVSIGGGFCRPVILQTDKPVLKVMQMKHPTVKTAADTDFIPNDIILGGDDACSIVVTGMFSFVVIFFSHDNNLSIHYFCKHIFQQYLNPPNV